MKVDIEKAFDSINHCFLIKVLEKYGFEKDFKILIKWIKILLQNQESCTVNGGTATNYFKLEIVFLLTKESKKIIDFNIFDKTFLYTAYADGTTFFLKDTKSVIELMNIFNTFSKFSGLKPNKSKCEIAGIDALKRVQVAICSMRSIDLVSNIVKILGIYYSYNEKLEIQENFKRHFIKIKKNSRIWRMRDLSIPGKITVFKTLAISKIVHLALVKTITNSIIQELNKIQKEFMWKTGNPKIKHDTL